MDDTSKEDDRLNAPEVRGSGYLEDTQSGMPILTDLCLAMVSDPLGMIRGLGELVTCIYGPAVTYAFPDPLVAAYRNSVVQVSLISVLDGTALNWCRQEEFRARMSDTVLLGKVEDPELMVFNFRGQLQCRLGRKRKGPSEAYTKFWNLNPLAADKQEILRIPAWKGSFDPVKSADDWANTATSPLGPLARICNYL